MNKPDTIIKLATNTISIGIITPYIKTNMGIPIHKNTSRIITRISIKEIPVSTYSVSTFLCGKKSHAI